MLTSSNFSQSAGLIRIRFGGTCGRTSVSCPVTSDISIYEAPGAEGLNYPTRPKFFSPVAVDVGGAALLVRPTCVIEL